MRVVLDTSVVVSALLWGGKPHRFLQAAQTRQFQRTSQPLKRDDDMQTPQKMNTVLEKLQRLPPERIMEVEDFIDFLSSRDSDRSLVKAAQAVTAANLKAIWDNDDDADYDRL